ncbi:fimbria/pilus outer membrane usher protein [Roseicella frigidaeris]|uniref:Fimbrial biogenesis outer membrane usher protein n=1 Tax=Roseicella frigidaeris TaxID=2230885 RepID=A0A327MD45_9PROT|nr:fimbria/pilus outer membrane usher protein [Roseicella frigidaeris]RAI59973.1 fimbrial biogenesis outer membrane usher protein [Roseicella frigidaeris]
MWPVLGGKTAIPGAGRERLPRAGPRAALACLLAIAPVAAAGAGERPLLLEVVRNGQPIGKIGEFLDQDGALSAAAEELRSLGIAVPPEAQGRVALQGLRGLRYQLDEAAQQIRLTAEDAALLATELGPPPRQFVAPEAGWGGLLNYDLLGTSAAGRALGAGFLEARLFSPFGLLSNSLLAYTERQGAQAPVIRLDTSLVHDDPDSLRRYTLGDVISGGLAWTRPVRMGGAQVASHFGIRPDLVTFPVPSIGGSAAVPSSVDVLVNGVRQFSGTVEPGPFAVRQLPLFTGAGEVAVVVRDALGRETTSTLPFYATGSLLAPGLAAYSAEAGLVRRSYGLRSDDYREAALNGTLRYGLADWLTAEGHAEFAGQLAMGGAGAVLALGTLGIASAAAAASTSRSAAGARRGTGWQLAAGLERAGRRFSLAGSIIMASRDFNDLAGLAGDPVPRRVARASLGLPLGDLGTLALAFAHIDRGDRLPAADAALAGAVTGRTTILSLTYTRGLFNRATLYATAYGDPGGRQGAGAILGLSFALGMRSAANLNVGHDGGGTYGGMQASQSAALPGEWGWRLYDTEGSLSRHLGEVEYRANWARMTAGLDQVAGRTAARAGIQGSLATLGGGVFAANLIQDSFAVVETGQPQVAVTQENRPAGRTDGAGRLLVTGLRSYDNNRLAIDTGNLPIDAAVGETSRVVRPLNRSGVLVRFPITRGTSARVRLVDAAGAELPIGAVAVLAASGAAAPVGHGGETFFDGLAAENRIAVTLPDGRGCAARFAFAPSADSLPLLGPVPCR